MKTARQEILNKLKNSVHPVSEKPDFNAPIYYPLDKPSVFAFKENLEKANGNVYLFDSPKGLFQNLKTFLSKFERSTIVCFEKEFIDSLNEEKLRLLEFSEIPENVEVGITGCEFLIAHTGSVMVSSAQKGGRQMFVYPPIHIVIARRNQLVEYLENAFTDLTKKYNKLPSHISLITGPSRTADIEKTLVMGAHGPRELHVFLA